MKEIKTRLKNFFEKNRVLKLLRDNLKLNYLVVLAIFGIIIFYNLSFSDVEKIKENKSAFYQSGIALEAPNLTNKNPELVFGNLLKSQEGDFYRLSFMAKADSDETIYVKLRGDMGNEVEIDSFEIRKKEDDENKLEYYEMIFEVADEFNEIIFYKRDVEDLDQKMKWDDGNVYIYNVKTERLDVKNEEEADEVLPTVIGRRDIVEDVYLNSENGDVKSKLAQKNETVRRFFTSEWDNLLGMKMNLEKIGDGGEGKYKLKIGWLDKENRKSDLLKTISFSMKSLEKYRQKNGLYYFELNVPVEKGQTYYIEISNRNASVDEGNYLALNKLPKSENSYFSVDVMNFFEFDEAIVLKGAKIEDFGARLEYSYRSNRNIEEVLNVFDFKGKLFFDEDDEALVSRLQTGNYFTYKIDTIYPFSTMRVGALQKKIQQDRNVKFEYSFDNKKWKEIERKRENEDAPLGYSLIIENGNSDTRVIYFRVMYTGEKEKKTRSFGLTDFEVNALLIRPEK